MGKETAKNFQQGPVGKHLLNLVIPSLGGTFAITLFNLTDTYFVSKLGTDQLAAMGFTFPIVMLVGAISSGISVGVSSLTARSLGEKNYHMVNRTATDGILLSLFIVSIISIIGLLTINPLFTLLGADENSLILIKQYMKIWYLGLPVVLMPSVCDSCIRALGDMKRPLCTMLICALTNVILDPILIFGYFGINAMGIRGAALTTVLSRFFGMFATLGFAYYHHKIIDFKYNHKFEIFESWKKILHVGLPSTIVKLLPQSLKAFLTLLVTKSIGVLGIAAIAIATKLESFSTIVTFAVAIALVPITGQNWGAKKYDRVLKIEKILNKTAIIYGIFLTICSILFTKSLAALFTKNNTVINYVYIYMNIIMLGTIGLNLYNWISEQLNAIGNPKYVLLINITGTLFLLIPGIYVGFLLNGYIGMLWGLCITQILMGIISIFISRKTIKI